MARLNTEVSGTQEAAVERTSLLDNYVFMDKTFNVLETGIKTGKNVVLYGPGGHGKSEYALEYLYEKNIAPYVITMGKGMTADRLFGGINVKEYDFSGKIEYLVENSFMNHEYVIFEEMMDSPDYILEQLKDILSSGQFRNGTQVFDIKCKFIIGNTNKTREEFAKNDSLKALMERFPLEHNVVWDNYTEASYKTLLEKRFGVNKVDPIIPFLLQEYSKNDVKISPRIALDCYEVYEVCGPDSLIYIAEFAKKPQIINDSLSKFQETIRFKQLGAEIEDIVNELSSIMKQLPSNQKRQDFIDNYGKLKTKVSEVNAMTVVDDMVQHHTALIKAGKEHLANFQGKFQAAMDAKSRDEAEAKGIPYDKGDTSANPEMPGGPTDGKKKKKSWVDIMEEKAM